MHREGEEGGGRQGRRGGGKGYRGYIVYPIILARVLGEMRG